MITKIATAALREGRTALNGVRYRLVYGGGEARCAHIAHDTVAVVRPDLIGDFVLATPGLVAMRRAFAGRHLTLVGHPGWRELALWLNAHPIVADTAGFFDAFEALHPARLTRWRDFRAACDMLARHETVVYFVNSRTIAMDALISLAPGRRVGVAGGPANMPAAIERWNRRGYTELIQASTADSEWRRNADFVRALAGPELAPADPPRWVLPAGFVEDTLRAVSGRVGAALDRPYVAISPFTSAALRAWPLERYEELAHRLQQAFPGVRIVTLGARGSALSPRVTWRGQMVDLVGATTLVESVAILAGAALSISGDTAAAHLASAVGTSALAVTGGGQPARFFPYPSTRAGAENAEVYVKMPCFGCNWSCRYCLFPWRPAPCLLAVPVEEVYARAVAMLERALAHPRLGKVADGGA